MAQRPPDILDNKPPDIDDEINNIEEEKPGIIRRGINKIFTLFFFKQKTAYEI